MYLDTDFCNLFLKQKPIVFLKTVDTDRMPSLDIDL
jgi:hypothetical protein